MVLIAVDGQAGVNMANSESPDLILINMSLPVMDSGTPDQGRSGHAIDSGDSAHRTRHGG